MRQLGDNVVGAWILRQHPLVTFAASAGLAVAVGTALSTAAFWSLKRLKPR